MVWFQCEDCGENLKKPKLPSHFRVCSSFKEKYGPKGQVKVSNGMPAKPNKYAKQQPDFDITVGLTKRPPWVCRVKLGSKGIEALIPSDLQGLNEYEQKIMDTLKPELKASIDKGIAFAQKQAVAA